MSFLTVLWVLTIFWTVVYSFKARDGRSTIILPTTTTHSASPSRTHRYKSKKWNITIQNLHLRAETSSLNDGHDLLAQVLSRRKFLKATLKRFYDFGVLFGVAGFLAGIVVMGLSSHNLILKLVDFPSGDRVSSGVKRELDGIPESVVPSQFTVKPIVSTIRCLSEEFDKQLNFTDSRSNRALVSSTSPPVGTVPCAMHSRGRPCHFCWTVRSSSTYTLCYF